MRIQVCYAAIIGLCLSAPAEALPFWAGSGNPSNDKLLAMPEQGQAGMLSKATRNTCQGKKPYYMGTQTRGVNKGVSFWSLTCDNTGGQLAVMIAPDAVGSTKVVSCNLLRGLPWKCYEKIKQ